MLRKVISKCIWGRFYSGIKHFSIIVCYNNSFEWILFNQIVKEYEYKEN